MRDITFSLVVNNFGIKLVMSRYNYMKLALDFFPDEIIEQYDLCSLVCPNGWIYMEICKGIPGLKNPAASPMTG